MRIVMAAIAAAALCASAHAATPIGLGPYHVGMTLAEARAAAPGKTALDNRSLVSDAVVSVTTFEALAYATWPLSVTAHPGYYGGYTLTFDGVVQAKNRKECRTRTLALIAALEPHLGPFAPKAILTPKRTFVPGRIEAHIGANGVPMISTAPGYSYGPAVKALKAGASSKIQMIENGRDMRWAGQRELADQAIAISASGDYWDAPKVGLPSTCSAVFEIVKASAPPAREDVAFESIRLVESPTPADLHYSLEGLALPAKGATLIGDCRLSRYSGRVDYCRFDPPADDALAAAARKRAQAMRFDRAALDPDNPVPLYTKITFKLAPDDRLKTPPPRIPTVLTAGPPPLPLTRQPTAQELYDYYPVQALRRGIEADVRLSCLVNPDLSLACDKVDVIWTSDGTDNQRADFEQAARGIAKLLRVAATTSWGAATAGTRQTLPIKFRIPN